MKKTAIALLFVTVSASALTPPPRFQTGDVIVASAEPACGIDPPPPSLEQTRCTGGMPRACAT